MLEFLKKKKEYPFDINDQYKEVENNFYNTVTPDTIRAIPHVYAQLEKEFYQNFDFMKLYEPSLEDGIFGKIVPYLNLGVLIIVVIILIAK